VIKILAALFMLIDHVGMIFFPENYLLRIIGRVSMPLFAYCIARGFYFSEKKGTTGRYVRNLFLFAAVSQVPFTVLSLWIEGGFALNIGFTWLLSVCFMKALITEKKPLALGCMCALIFLTALAVPMDYGLYGVLYPCVFYLFMYRVEKPQYAFVGMTALYALYVLTGGSQIQAFSIVTFPVLIIAKQYDEKLSLPRRFFYWFYPLHIGVLLLLKGVILSC